MLKKGEAKRINGAKLSLALVILLAILLTVGVGVSFAKNLTSLNGGDKAQVSVLIIDSWGSPSDNLTIDCGQGITTAEYNFAVTNTKDGKTAELSFRYDVIVTLAQSLPNGVSITVDGIGGTVASDGKTVTFTNVGRFAAGNSQTHDHTLVFSVVDIGSLSRDYVFTNTSVSVRAEQVS